MNIHFYSAIDNISLNDKLLFGTRHEARTIVILLLQIKYLHKCYCRLAYILTISKRQQLRQLSLYHYKIVA